MSYARIVALTSLAMVAFAGNSLLCRVALKHTSIDPASFTTIRLISGAVMLWLIVRMRRGTYAGGGSWLSAFALFAYAAGFSFAYVSLPAATGALLLFGAVQVTMIGNRFSNLISTTLPRTEATVPKFCELALLFDIFTLSITTLQLYPAHCAAISSQAVCVHRRQNKRICGTHSIPVVPFCAWVFPPLSQKHEDLLPHYVTVGLGCGSKQIN